MSALPFTLKGITQRCEAWHTAESEAERDTAHEDLQAYFWSRPQAETQPAGKTDQEGALLAAIYNAEHTVGQLYPHNPNVSALDALDLTNAQKLACEYTLTTLARLQDLTGLRVAPAVIAYLSRPADPIEPVTDECAIEVTADIDTAIIDACTGGHVLARLIDAVEHDTAPTAAEFERIRWTWGNVHRRILDARAAFLKDAETEATKGGAA